MTNSIHEIGGADLIFVIGSNTSEAHPIIGLQINKALRRGAKLIVADPRRIELAEKAHWYLPLKPGTNIALINGMINVIIAEDLYDKEFVAERTEGFEEMKASVAKYTPEYVEEITGVPADLIREAARAYATTEKAMILYTMGITQHNTGTANVWALANLVMLTGHVGKPHTGLNPLRGQNNVQGACDMGGLPNVFPAYQPVTDPAAQEKFARLWGVDDLPAKPGLTVGEMMDAAAEGKIKAMYIMGENPMLSDPDLGHVEHALKNLEFLVVQDIFLTETARLAHVVLPAATFAEKDGTFTNTERRVQRVRKAIEPVGNSRPDWQIIAEIATRMGYPMTYSSAEEIFAEIRQAAPSYAGITYERLEKGGLQWPCPSEDHPGTPILHVGKFTRGKGKFHVVEYLPPAETPDAEYPFILTTGRRLQHYHTGTMTRRAKVLEEVYPEEHLEIHPDDACRLGIASGDLVRVTSRRGSITIKALVTERVTPGVVFTSFHFRENPINRLTVTDRDPVAKIPQLKACAVKVEKVS